MTNDINQLRTELTVQRAKTEVLDQRYQTLEEENRRLTRELDEAEATIRDLRVEVAELTRPLDEPPHPWEEPTRRELKQEDMRDEGWEAYLDAHCGD